ncbi:DUF3572 domain-containing protein [Sphingomonas azotifigens]|uniref:DUF3572 domain-containing protein n=1 Tax=Sphingomonas azotifigens TaxID=330920 RepID=UPI000A04E41E|nr:DUF3572 domain-containing protein [Sphingomonas azotifigens]
MAGDVTNPETVALQALAWILSEPGRASRLLDLTGLDPATLRARAGEPALLAAVLGFLESYEPDLIACADALDLSPAALVDARHQLERA